MDDISKSAQIPPPNAVPPETAAAPVQPSPQQMDNGIQMYDISGQQPVLGSLQPDEVTEAVASGRFSFPKGSPIPVVSPEGEHGSIDPAEAPVAFQSGYKFLTPNEQRIAKYSTPEQQAKAVAEGLAKGVLGPIATGIERIAGVKPSDILGREEANPVAHTLGEIGGFAGSMATGVGEAALVTKAGQSLNKALKIGEGAGILSKMGGAATQAATEMALIQSGDEISKMILSDPDQSLQTAITDIGLSGVLGGAFGAGLGAISPLWKATAGPRVNKILEDFKGQMKFNLDNPDIGTALTKELDNHYTAIKNMADDVYGVSGAKAKDIAKSLPEMHGGISESVERTNKLIAEQLEIMQRSPNTYPPRLMERLAKDYDEFLNKVNTPELKPADAFDAIQDMKKATQRYAKFDKQTTELEEGYQFVQDMKGLSNKLKVGLEDNKVWGKAGERQQAINGAFSQFKTSLDDFESKFTTKLAGERVLDPGKITSYLNQIGKPNAEIKQTMLKNFLDSADSYRKVIKDTHINLGLDNPVAETSTAIARRTLEDASLGASIADTFVEGGAAKLAGNMAGALVGAVLGKHHNLTEVAALLGAATLGPLFKTVLPAIVKPIMEAPTSASGMKAAMDYATSIIKGEAMVNKAAKNIFKSTAQILPSNAYPTIRGREKLEKQLDKLQLDENKLLNAGQDLGHYLPDHNVSAGSMAARAVAYLSAQKPMRPQAAPLDAPSVVTPAQRAQYNRVLDLAQQPLLIAQSIKDGTITPKDIEVVKTLYPGLYAKLGQQFAFAAIDAKAKGEDIPYKTRLGLSLFMGEPMDSTMTPSSIMAAQAALTGPGQDQQSQQQQQIKPPSQGSMTALNKMPKMYQTASQSAADSRRRGEK